MDYESHTKSILLISDNQVDIRRIEQQFMDKGSLDCRLYRCTAISAAEEMLGRKNLVIDAVILDLRLTDSAASGDYYSAIRNAAGEIPIIALTGGDDDEQAIADPVMAAGANAHVYRANFGSLVWTINSLLFPKSGG